MSMNAEGGQRTFATGAVRDSANKKPMLQLISPFFLRDLGEWLRFACTDRQPKPYPPRNWEKGMPFSETLGSIERHTQSIKAGDNSEDNYAAIGFGAMALCHYRHEIAAGRLPASLDDLPHYEQRLQTGVDPAAPGEDRTVRIPLDIQVYQDHDDKGHAIVEGIRYNGIVRWDVGEQRPVLTDIVKAPTLYIAGPMRGYPRLNWDEFFAAEDALQEAGYNTINPARIDKEQGVNPDDYNDGAPVEQSLLQDIVRRDIDRLLGLDPDHGDGIALLDCASDSIGARAECSVADWLRLPHRHFKKWITAMEVANNAE